MSRWLITRVSHHFRSSHMVSFYMMISGVNLYMQIIFSALTSRILIYTYFMEISYRLEVCWKHRKEGEGDDLISGGTEILWSLSKGVVAKGRSNWVCIRGWISATWLRRCGVEGPKRTWERGSSRVIYSLCSAATK